MKQMVELLATAGAGTRIRRRSFPIFTAFLRTKLTLAFAKHLVPKLALLLERRVALKLNPTN